MYLYNLYIYIYICLICRFLFYIFVSVTHYVNIFICAPWDSQSVFSGARLKKTQMQMGGLSGCASHPSQHIPSPYHTTSHHWALPWCEYIGVEPKIGCFTPQNIHFNRVFHYKPSILGGFPPYFWKHPYKSKTRGVFLRWQDLCWIVVLFLGGFLQPMIAE